MISFDLKYLAEILSAKIIGNPKGIVDEVYFDSRTVFQPKNGLFISFDSNPKYIEDAYNKGIRVFIASKFEETNDDSTYLIVNSPLEALQKWGKIHRDKFNLPIIGITGSNGKTIVKEWLNQMLWNDFSIARSPKSYNSQIGVPLSVLQITDENNLGIFEAGISQPGEMEKLEEILSPDIGVLTHPGTAHLENFESPEEIIEEKIKLFKNTSKIIYDSDYEYAENLIEKYFPNKELYSFGKKEDNFIQLNKTEETPNGKKISIIYDSKNYEFLIPFHDEASVENILTVLTVIAAMGMDLEKYLPKTANLLPVEMRLEIKEAIRGSILINDSFNSDLHSLKVALNVLSQQPFPRKSLVLTDILQSSLDKDELYAQAAEMVNSHEIDDLILIGEYLPKYKNLFQTEPKVFESTEDFMKTLSVKNVDNEAILLKGARPYKLEKISAFLEKKSHDTVLEINLQALIDNLNFFKNRLKPETKVMAMIKANSYGTGSFEIAQTLEHQKIDYLGAAYADEGVELRKAGITLPIMVMNPEQSSYSSIIDFKLEPEIYSLRVLKMFIRELKEKSIIRPYPIHIKIDSGMNRLGFRTEDLSELADFLKTEKRVEVKSVFTHLATADVSEEREFALEQLNKFNQAYDSFCSALGIRPIKHALNSAGIIHFAECQFDMIRLGIGMYGISDDKEVQKQLKAVTSFKTVISQISNIEKGETVSYGRRFKAERKTRIATLPVGYADGIRRSYGYGKGFVNVNGELVSIVGTVCMDMLMLDVTDIDCNEGDEVIIFGGKPNISEVANWMETIPYEVLTSISSRVKRVYYRE